MPVYSTEMYERETARYLSKVTRQILFWSQQWEEDASINQDWAQSTETKDGRLFKCWGVLKEKYPETLGQGGVGGRGDVGQRD